MWAVLKLNRKRVNYMIKLNIDSVNDRFELEHDMFCKEHVIDEITKVLDTIIIDYEIKTRPTKNSLSDDEKMQLLISKRKEYLELIEKKESDYKVYFANSMTHITNN